MLGFKLFQLANNDSNTYSLHSKYMAHDHKIDTILKVNVYLNTMVLTLYLTIYKLLRKFQVEDLKFEYGNMCALYNGKKMREQKKENP